jgi:hypothetical protein
MEALEELRSKKPSRSNKPKRTHFFSEAWEEVKATGIGQILVDFMKVVWKPLFQKEV